MKKKRSTLTQFTDFDLKLLRLFKTVVECGSFSAAENTLGITKSAISMQMTDLEKRLGLRLCQRGRAGFSLTDEGVEVLEATEALLSSVENFRSQINQMNHQLRGELNIGIVNNLVTQPKMSVTQALAQLSSLSDGVKINISMSTPAEITKGLFDGRLHVGVIPQTAQLSGLDYELLYEEKSCLYVGRTHPLYATDGELPKEELSKAKAVLPIYPMTEEAINLHQLLNCSATASDREGIAFLILTGNFIGFLPDHYAANWVLKGELKCLNESSFYFNTPLVLVTRAGRRPNLVLESFLEAFQDTAPIS